MTRKKRELGFTLIELMIVVAIVGVLAALAVVGYRKMVLNAHTSEATHMVQSIRTAQETYHAETQSYVSTSPDGINPTQLYPTQNSPPGNWKTNWTPPTTTCASPSAGTPNCFGLLPVQTDGPVMYGYATLAGTSAKAPPSIALPNTTVSAGTPPSTDWYWVTASGNPSGTTTGLWSYVVANSFSNDLFIQDQQ